MPVIHIFFLILCKIWLNKIFFVWGLGGGGGGHEPECPPSRSGPEAHPRVMIIKPLLMLQAKSQNHRPPGSEEEDLKIFCYL